MCMCVCGGVRGGGGGCMTQNLIGQARLLLVTECQRSVCVHNQTPHSVTNLLLLLIHPLCLQEGKMMFPLDQLQEGQR